MFWTNVSFLKRNVIDTKKEYVYLKKYMFLFCVSFGHFPSTVKKAVAGCIRINYDMYLYAVVEGALSGQSCCPPHLFISNP